MVVFPHAKINIGLNVIEKRSDGFHNIETVFYPVGLNDILEVIPARQEKEEKKQITFTLTGIDIPGNAESNLCVKAYNLINRDYPLPPVQAYLHKIIPVGAGLGGGSSDAAFFINAINELLDLNLSWGEKHHYAKQLGSDCSFFIAGRPAFATGKGDILEPAGLDLKGYYLALVCPHVHISTPEAYAMVTPKKPVETLEEILESTPLKDWKYRINNDFEEPVFKKYPEIRAIKERFYDTGALYASMSGSGSSVYGIFKEEAASREIATGDLSKGNFCYSGPLPGAAGAGKR